MANDYYNLGPLTTVDSNLALPSCSIIVTDTAGAFWAQTCSNGQLYDNPRCWPTATIAATPPLGPLSGYGYYSPGLDCPAGYQTACHGGALATGGPRFSFQFEVDPSLNIAGCCPYGYICTKNELGWQTCASTPVFPATLRGAACDGNSFGYAKPVTASIVWAPLVQIVAEQTSDAQSQPYLTIATPSQPVYTPPISTPGPTLTRTAYVVTSSSESSPWYTNAHPYSAPLVSSAMMPAPETSTTTMQTPTNTTPIVEAPKISMLAQTGDGWSPVLSDTSTRAVVLLSVSLLLLL